MGDDGRRTVARLYPVVQREEATHESGGGTPSGAKERSPTPLDGNNRTTRADLRPRESRPRFQPPTRARDSATTTVRAPGSPRDAPTSDPTLVTSDRRSSRGSAGPSISHRFHRGDSSVSE